MQVGHLRLPASTGSNWDAHPVGRPRVEGMEWEGDGAEDWILGPGKG